MSDPIESRRRRIERYSLVLRRRGGELQRIGGVLVRGHLFDFADSAHRAATDMGFQLDTPMRGVGARLSGASQFDGAALGVHPPVAPLALPEEAIKHRRDRCWERHHAHATRDLSRVSCSVELPLMGPEGDGPCECPERIPRKRGVGRRHHRVHIGSSYVWVQPGTWVILDWATADPRNTRSRLPSRSHLERSSISAGKVPTFRARQTVPSVSISGSSLIRA